MAAVSCPHIALIWMDRAARRTEAATIDVFKTLGEIPPLTDHRLADPVRRGEGGSEKVDPGRSRRRLQTQSRFCTTLCFHAMSFSKAHLLLTFLKVIYILQINKTMFAKPVCRVVVSGRGGSGGALLSCRALRLGLGHLRAHMLTPVRQITEPCVVDADAS